MSSNGAIDSRRATLPTKFAANRSALSVVSVQKKRTISGHSTQLSPIHSRASDTPTPNTAPIYARVSSKEMFITLQYKIDAQA